MSILYYCLRPDADVAAAVRAATVAAAMYCTNNSAALYIIKFNSNIFIPFRCCFACLFFFVVVIVIVHATAMRAAICWKCEETTYISFRVEKIWKDGTQSNYDITMYEYYIVIYIAADPQTQILFPCKEILQYFFVYRVCYSSIHMESVFSHNKCLPQTIRVN